MSWKHSREGLLSTPTCPLFFGTDSPYKKMWVNELEAHRPSRSRTESRVFGLDKTQKHKKNEFMSNR